MLKQISGALLIAMVAGTAANAAVPVYSTPGTVNPASYSFEKLSSGDLIVTFTGATAGYTNLLGVVAGGVDLGTGISNKVALGTTYNFGYVAAGTSLQFYIDVTNRGVTYSSDTDLNFDGRSHFFAGSYGGGDSFGSSVLTPGFYTYIGFEDRAVGSDWDYDDATYVFADVGQVSPVPEPATWALMIAGFGLVGFASRRRRRIA